MAHVELRGVSKIYTGDVRAVDRIDLDIHDREFMVLVGPSGCGKSTTLRMIAGLEDISEGTVRIADRVVNDVPPKDRDIAMVFQNYALYPHMTVYRNMGFGLKLRRRELGLSRKEIDQRVRQAAQILGLTPLLDRKPKALSGGQRQRVAVGRAIVRNPKAFLFDEPLSNLDAKLRVETRAELKRLHQRLQTTTIYVTHDQEEAMTLGDRIVVMRDGHIHQVAPPLEVYEWPVDRFVAGFVGMPPMNFLSGRLESPSVMVIGQQRIHLPADKGEYLRKYVGQTMTLGVRAENLTPVVEGAAEDVGSAEGALLRGKLTVTEPLGDRIDLYATLDADGAAAGSVMDRPLICRTDARVFGKLRLGDIMKFRMDLERVHVFEAGDSGVNVTLTRESSHAAA